MIVRTPRLALRPFAASDLRTLHRQWNDREVRRYLFDDAPVPLAVVSGQIAASRALFRERGFGFFTIRRGARTIGFAGLRPFGRPRRIELLYALRPAYWARGYATEASLAVLRLGFARGLRTIWAGADPPNSASFRVMRRLGFRRVGRRVIGGRPAIYYRISRSWRHAPSSRPSVARPHPTAQESASCG